MNVNVLPDLKALSLKVTGNRNEFCVALLRIRGELETREVNIYRGFGGPKKTVDAYSLTSTVDYLSCLDAIAMVRRRGSEYTQLLEMLKKACKRGDVFSLTYNQGEHVKELFNMALKSHMADHPGDNALDQTQFILLDINQILKLTGTTIGEGNTQNKTALVCNGLLPMNAREIFIFDAPKMKVSIPALLQDMWDRVKTESSVRLSMKYEELK